MHGFQWGIFGVTSFLAGQLTLSACIPTAPCLCLQADHETFETTESGASHTFPQAAGTIRKNGFMVIKGRPCKVRAPRVSRSRHSTAEQQ